MEARSGCGDETAGRRRWQDQARACRPAGAVEEARIATGTGLGGGVRMERRGRRRLTGPRISARPGSCRQPHGEWARDRGGNEAGTGSAQNPPLTSHRPARPSLGHSAGPAVLAPPSWPRLLSSSLPGHVASARTAGRLRVQPRPTAERGSSAARKRSMRSTRGLLRWGRAAPGTVSGALPAEPRVVVTLLLSQQP